jgi:hypothetical protein
VYAVPNSTRWGPLIGEGFVNNFQRNSQSLRILEWIQMSSVQTSFGWSIGGYAIQYFWGWSRPATHWLTESHIKQHTVTVTTYIYIYTLYIYTLYIYTYYIYIWTWIIIIWNKTMKTNGFSRKTIFWWVFVHSTRRERIALQDCPRLIPCPR